MKRNPCQRAGDHTALKIPLLFLRICEDRGIEDYERLKKASEAKSIYPALVKLFQQADDRYNSGLFHFRAEKGRHEDHDALTPHLVIDDALLKPLIRGLYYPESPYEFSVFTADILGQVYEQFLGKVITLSASHKATVEDKPEVKKAGGVFYTPTYIVDYIVKQTVGTLINEIEEHEVKLGAKRTEKALEKKRQSGLGAGIDVTDEKMPKRVIDRVATLRILDPSCGSGSFVIGAYQHLLDWHLSWFVRTGIQRWAKGKNPPIVQRARGDWVLSLTERKRILLNNIYGVDIDSQAVEVTKLSLLLKVLEVEGVQAQQTLGIHDRVLPDLGDNIKCGNSLIGSDFYAQKDLPEMDTEAHLRINVFDWDGKDGFPEIMRAGGFDAVIGNPPYIRIQRIAHTEADYLFKTYETPTSKMDMSLVFLEKSLRLINNRGRAAFICTSQWLSTDYGRNLRRKLKSGELHQIVDFGSLPVFASASTYPAIFTLSRLRASDIEVKRVTSRDNLNLEGIVAAPSKHLVLDSLSDAPWMLGDFDLIAAAKSKSYKTIPLRDFGKAYIGCKTGMNDAFILSKEEAILKKLEKELVFPYAYRGEEVERYCEVEPSSVVIYPYRKGPEGQSQLLDADELAAEFPHIHAHLTQFRPVLKQRQDSRKLYAAGADWFRHLRPGNFNYIDNPKLVFKAISRQSCGGLLSSRTAFDGANCPAILIENLNGHGLHYLLGVLNSRLLSHYLRQVCPPKLGGYVKFSATCLSDSPIRVIDSKNKSDQATHDRIVTQVEKMLSLHRQRTAAKTPHEQTALDRQISATDASIDREVYTLYGLTEDEIAIVEGRAVVDDESEATATRYPKSTDADGSTAESYGAAAHHHGMILREDAPAYNTQPKTKP